MIESQTIEFKSILNDKANKTMLAFLNTDGGVLYIGIDDDGVVIGVDDAADVAKKASDSFRDSISPDPTSYFTIEPELIDGKHVVKATIERGTAIPYCFSSIGLIPQGVYVRVGSASVTASREHIRQMIKDNGSGQYIAELSVEQNLSFDYANNVFSDKEIPFGEQQKQSLGLLRPDGRYTNLALLLSDECPFTTKVAIFEGTDKDRFKDRKEFSGSVFRQIDEVLTYLNVYNRVGGNFEGVYRIDHPDYPEITLREAFVNAVIHRDYYIDGSILVSMFDDRLEIMSLGGVMPGVTRELMLAGVSVARNEKLAAVFYRLKMIEAFGTGIPRIFGAYKDSAVKPEIPVMSGGFLIRLPNRNFAHDAVLKFSDSRIPENERKIIEAFDGTDFIKEEAAALLGLSVSGAYKLLRRMNERGLLDSRKAGKQLIYNVTSH